MRTAMVLTACLAMLIALVVTPVGSATLVGQWTFDHYNFTGPLENKAPGVSWSTMTFGGDGSAKVSDGALVLPRWLDVNSGMYMNCFAYSMLRTDLGPSGYFQNSTQVIWMKWPGFDPGYWGRIARISKYPSDEWNPPIEKAGEAMGYLDSTFADSKWGGFHMWEQILNGSLVTQPQWIRPQATLPTMPTDKWVKLALVIQIVNPTTWQYSMYGDFGSGLAQLGITRQFDRATWSWVSSFGQYGSNCLEDPAGGPRYDGFGLMEQFDWATPQSPGQIEFDEARVYSGAMTQAEIADLKPAVGPAVGTSIKSLYDPLAQAAAAALDWTLWGKAIALDPPDADNFMLDDGSGKTAQVHYAAHGLVGDGTEYVSVRGSLEYNELGGPVLHAGSLKIQN